ncbi:MAG: hypothetical protein AAF958_11790 [Planctomycetota bacterium]
MDSSQTLLTIPGCSDQQRLRVVLETTLCGHRHITLCQESHQPGLGWYVQSQIPIEASQINDLRAVLSTRIVQRSIVEQSLPAAAEAATEERAILSFPVAS